MAEPRAILLERFDLDAIFHRSPFIYSMGVDSGKADQAVSLLSVRVPLRDEHDRRSGTQPLDIGGMAVLRELAGEPERDIGISGGASEINLRVHSLQPGAGAHLDNAAVVGGASRCSAVVGFEVYTPESTPAAPGSNDSASVTGQIRKGSLKSRLLIRAALGLAIFAATTVPGHTVTKIVYGNVAEMTLSQAPMVAAKQLGYFAAEGLDVELMGFKGTGTLIPQMLARRVDIGYPNPDTFILSRAPGKEKLPIKYFYNMTPHSRWEFAVLADSPITKIKDLDGKKIGVGALSYGNVPITKAQFKKLGINATLLPVGLGSAAFLALTTKRIDVLNLFESQNATMESEGIAIRRIAQLPQYEALMSNGFVAHEDLIRDKPEVIIGFGRAMAKATVFCEANPKACVKLFWKEYPTTKPGGEEAKVLDAGVQIFSATLKIELSFPPGPREYGKFDPQIWRDFAEALFDGEQLPTKDVDVDACYTNAFALKFMDFDADKIRAQAAAFKD